MGADNVVKDFSAGPQCGFDVTGPAGLTISQSAPPAVVRATYILAVRQSEVIDDARGRLRMAGITLPWAVPSYRS